MIFTIIIIYHLMPICNRFLQIGKFLSFFDKKLLTNDNRCVIMLLTKQRKEPFTMKKNESARLTSILIKIVYALAAVCCVMAPYMVEYYDRMIIAKGEPSVYVPLLITLYCAVPAAVIALICLDKLLNNIIKNQPFVSQNVKLLRIISYCCFAEALVFIYFATLKPFALIVIIACAFMGLILRVIKNVFEHAVAIREENDFTI